MKVGCIKKTRVFDGKRFSLKSGKTPVSRLKANTEVTKLKRTYRFVRKVKVSKTPVLYRVYATGKKPK